MKRPRPRGLLRENIFTTTSASVSRRPQPLPASTLAGAARVSSAPRWAPTSRTSTGSPPTRRTPPFRPRRPPSAGASPSSPADAKGGGTSKAARLRAKKAAARAAQKARRREEKARFPPKRVDEHISSDGEDEDDENSGSDEKDEKDEKGEKLERVVAMRRRGSDADRSADKTHHGVLNVEGVVVDGKLVLVDRESKHVYSSTRRAHDGTHLRVGVWDPEAGTVRRLPAPACVGSAARASAKSPKLRNSERERERRLRR